MKRSICIVMTALLCLALLTFGVSAQTYDLSNTDLSIRLDDTMWYVFTRDNIENNPELDELGITYDFIYEVLYDNDAYMDAIIGYEDGGYMELFIRKVPLDTGVANLTNYENDEVLEFAEALAEKAGTETYGVYENRYKFAKLDYFDEEVGCYVCEYITIVNKDDYTLTFQSETEFEDWEYEEMETIVDSIQFEIDTSLKEEKDGFWNNVITNASGGAVVGGIAGAIIGFVNKKKKKAAQEEEAPPANGPELD